MNEPLFLAGLLLAFIGLAGSILPALPGTPLVLAGLCLAAWADNFERVGWPTLLILTALTVAAHVVDFLATAMGARRAGASRQAVVGAAIGTFAGIFFGLPGLLAGPFLGAAAGEFLARGDLLKAGHVGLGTWFGLLLGTAAKLALIFTMLGVFVAGWFF